MIDVKTAVQAATIAAREFYEGENLKGLLLEEVELSEDDSYWRITLSFFVPDTNPSGGFAAMLAIGEGIKQFERKYKAFDVDAESGEVRSMKIRTP